MARTPLLRTLRNQLREVLAARKRGLPVDVLRHDRARARRDRLSRRQFLGAAAAGGAALALPRAARAAVARPTVAIVGGGIAGLTCALTLRDRNLASTVYEASGRIGGRMFSNTQTFAAGQVAEWGGELIDTGHRTVRRLARRYGLALDDLLAAEPAGATETYFFEGRYYAKADADADFLAIADAVAADLDAAGYPTRFDDFTPGGAALDHLSVHEWIESRVPGGHASPLGQLLDVAYNIEFGAESTDQSALNLLYLLAFQPDARKLAVFGESDERFHIRGGNQRLPEAIAAELGDAVHTGHCLTRLRQTPAGRYELTFQAGAATREVTADLVVLAVPFAVLDAVDLTGAGFDARKLAAIQQLGRGHNGKLTLQFASRAWNGSGPWPGPSGGSSYSDVGYQASWETTRGQPGAPGLLTLYSGASVTDAMRANRPFSTQADPRSRLDMQRGLAQITQVFPGLSWNGLGTQSLFHRARHAGLAYSYYKVGQYTAFGGYEGAPQGNVFFCGEHTSQDYQGYMEGGAFSGRETGLAVALASR
ncbi:MAG: NAD(P)/FAD-dependent oxidoreductase [Kofleriaceae bacterium]